MNNKYDVLIIGSGGAGLAAAVAASEGGAKAAVLEKRKVVGGISVTGMGIFAVESRLQRQFNVPFTRDDAFKLYMEKTQWKADARLVRTYVNKTADTIEWLEGMGVRFELLHQTNFPGAVNQTGHLIVSPRVGTRPTCTAHMIELMLKRAKELGTDVLLETATKDIERVEGGYKLTASLPGGKTEEFFAPAVVFASGGYPQDPGLLKDHGVVAPNKVLNKNFYLDNPIPLTGEGIRMAWKLGAVPDGMTVMATTFQSGRMYPQCPESQLMKSLMHFAMPYLWVNKQGMRFVDEGCGNGIYLATAVSRQSDSEWFVIFDRDTVERVRAKGPDVLGYLDIADEIDIDGLMRAIIAKGGKDFAIADDIETLALSLGIDPLGLKETVEEYNGFCHRGHDELFVKERKYLYPVEKPKFYGFKRYQVGYGTQGGIKIDYKARAIDAENSPIPGVYAGGDCANSLVAHSVTMTYTTWGGSLGFAVNSGRMAGESAAEYVAGLRK